MNVVIDILGYFKLTSSEKEQIHTRWIRNSRYKIVRTETEISYYLDGKLHHTYGPAVIKYGNLHTYWYKMGLLHRLDGPAVLSENGKFWYQNGQRHREGGLPAVERACGDKEWWLNGQRHREGDLPAVEYAIGLKSWYLNGKRHRAGDLPAFSMGCVIVMVDYMRLIMAMV
jgi:hypothetical protein